MMESVPIIIGSDDESDSDVEILHEEKNNDLDVIFVSETTVKPKVETELVHIANTPARVNIETEKSIETCEASPSLNRNLSLSSNLGLNLTLHDSAVQDTNVVSPLDLSAKKSSDERCDGDSDSNGTFDSEHSEIPDLLNEFSSSSNLVSKSDAHFLPVSCDNGTVKSADLNLDIKTPLINKTNQATVDSEATSNLSCIDLLHSNSTTVPPNVTVGDIPVEPAQSQNKYDRAIKRSSSSLQATEIDSAKKAKCESSYSIFECDAWEKLKKDLDFLNNTTNDLSNNDKNCVQDICHDSGKKSDNKTGASSQTFRRGSLSSISDTVSNSKNLPPKKQSCFRQTSEPGTSSNGSSYWTPQPSCSTWGSEKCTSCNISLLGFRISRCTQGHATCALCLEENVKLVLTGKTKETLRCVQGGCDSHYPLSELKHSLPSMVVEILEAKLDNDYIDYIANMIAKNAGSSLKDKEDGSSEDNDPPEEGKVEDKEQSALDTEDIPQQEGDHKKIPADWPQNWDYMDERQGYMMIELEPESDEYMKVATSFYETLPFGTYDIVKISRVQNPIMWKYFTVKRTEMIHDNDGHTVEERHLFHGTNSSVLDAICKKGFDWRVCGKHGTVYGQGSYFATNSSYSHQYTDKGHSRRHRSFLMTYQTLNHSNPFFVTHHVPAHVAPPSGNLGMPPWSISSVQYASPNSSSSNQSFLTGRRFSSAMSSGRNLATSNDWLYNGSVGQQATNNTPSASVPSSPSHATSASVNTQQNNTVSASMNIQNSNFPLNQVIFQNNTSASVQQHTVDPTNQTLGTCSQQNSVSSSKKILQNSSQQNNGNSSSGFSLQMPGNNIQQNDVSSTIDLSKVSQSGLSSTQCNQSNNISSGSSNFVPVSPAFNSGTGSQTLHTSNNNAIPLGWRSSKPQSDKNNKMKKPDDISSKLLQLGQKINIQRQNILHRLRGQPVSDSEMGEKTLHKMFMAKVLVGKYTGGESWMRKPPPLDKINEPYGKCYDSCVDNVHDPKIFVIFDCAQAYPDYLIEYNYCL